MLAIPVSILITFVFEPYERQQVFDVVSHSLMFSTNIFLLYQVSYKGSSWTQANLEATGVLPMNFMSRQKINKA